MFCEHYLLFSFLFLRFPRQKPLEQMLAFLAAPLPFPARKTASPVFASQADLRQRVLFYIFHIHTSPQISYC